LEKKKKKNLYRACGRPDLLIRPLVVREKVAVASLPLGIGNKAFASAYIKRKGPPCMQVRG